MNTMMSMKLQYGVVDEDRAKSASYTFAPLPEL